MRNSWRWRAGLLDVDNTLVMSELAAFIACCVIINNLLRSKNVVFRFTHVTLMQRFVGCNFETMALKLAAEHQFSFAEGELEELVQAEVRAVIEQFNRHLDPTDGVLDLLERFQTMTLCAVSNSAEARIRACLKATGIDRYIKEDCVFSARNYGESKPLPRVYNEALRAIGASAEECFAVEDSVTGVLAARAAGICTVGYTGAYPEHEREELSLSLVANGANAVIDHWNELEEALISLCSISDEEAPS